MSFPKHEQKIDELELQCKQAIVQLQLDLQEQQDFLIDKLNDHLKQTSSSARGALEHSRLAASAHKEVDERLQLFTNRFGAIQDSLDSILPKEHRHNKRKADEQVQPDDDDDQNTAFPDDQHHQQQQHHRHHHQQGVTPSGRRVDQERENTSTSSNGKLNTDLEAEEAEHAETHDTVQDTVQDTEHGTEHDTEHGVQNAAEDDQSPFIILKEMDAKTSTEPPLIDMAAFASRETDNEGSSSGGVTSLRGIDSGTEVEAKQGDDELAAPAPAPIAAATSPMPASNQRSGFPASHGGAKPRHKQSNRSHGGDGGGGVLPPTSSSSSSDMKTISNSSLDIVPGTMSPSLAISGRKGGGKQRRR